MTTVQKIVIIFIINVNRRYLAIRGITVEVGGRIFEISNKKTTKAKRMEIDNVIFSPASVGK
jgi:hypothetical protein